MGKVLFCKERITPLILGEVHTSPKLDSFEVCACLNTVTVKNKLKYCFLIYNKLMYLLHSPIILYFMVFVAI